MPDEPRPDEEPVEVSSREERSRTLAEVLAHEERREQARLQGSREMKKQYRGFGVRHVVFLVTLVATTYVWLAAPAWARVDRPEPPTPAHREASLRLAIYLQAQRVEMYREENGHLPETLDETGPPLPGIRYTRTPRGTYHLDGQNDTLALFYSSSSLTSLAEFLAEGEELVAPDTVPPEEG